MLHKKRIVSFITLIVFLALTQTACAPNAPQKPNTNNKQGKTQNTKQESNISNNNTTAKYEDIKVVPSEAFNIFTKKHPDTKIQKLELDFEDGLYVYEVEGYDNAKKYELKINSMDGKILKEEQEDRNNDDKEGKIELEDVNKIKGLVDKTLKDAGNNYKIEEWTLKSEAGQPIFKIEVVDNKNNDIEYKYNVNTGELIEKD